MLTESSHTESSASVRLMDSAVTTVLPVTGHGRWTTQINVIQRKLPADASLTNGHTLRIAKANAMHHARAAAGVGQQLTKMPVAQLKQLANVPTTQRTTKSSQKIEQNRDLGYKQQSIELDLFIQCSRHSGLLVLH